MTPQQKMQTKLESLGIPYKEIRCCGRQIMVTAWSEDAARRWRMLLANFCDVRGPIESVERNQINTNTVLLPSSHTVWLVGGPVKV